MRQPLGGIVLSIALHVTGGRSVPGRCGRGTGDREEGSEDGFAVAVAIVVALGMELHAEDRAILTHDRLDR